MEVSYKKAEEYFDQLLQDAGSDMLPDGDILGAEKRESTVKVLSLGSKQDRSKIIGFCKENNISEDVFYNGVFAYVLAKLNGKKDALYTTVYDDIIPVYCTAEAEVLIADYLKGIAKQLSESISQDEFSFEEISAKYNITPDVMFVWQGETADLSEDVAAKAPLQIEMSINNDTLTYRGFYQSDRFSESYMETFFEYLDHVSGQFLARQHIKDVDLMTEKAWAMLDSFENTERDYPITDVVSMFREAAGKYPDRIAVICRDEKLTYSEVDDISDRICGRLKSAGIGKGTVVSVLIGRTSAMVTASLGILKTGAAYQPLDPTYPDERLNFMMKDANAAYLIADEDLTVKVSEYRGSVLLTKDIPSLPVCDDAGAGPTADDTFILLYTSGTTGVPKGVILEHRNLSNFCFWYREYYGLDENSTVGAYAGFGFDACMMDLYPALTAGATVFIVDEEMKMDLPEIEKNYNRIGVTHGFMTTQVGRHFYSTADVESLKYLSVGGEKLVPVRVRNNGTCLVNVYGPTECTIFTTVRKVDREYRRVPIGRPLANYRCYVVDEELNQLPVFVPGELLISGAGVGRGYLNRPEITEKAFIENPFSDDPAYRRAYRTGDVVRLLPNGEVDFIGRADSQVKIRGFRIELTEVESVIREYPGISDVCTDARDMGEAGKAIAAYIVSDDMIDIEDLKHFILERKPPYMVPTWIMQIDSIPLNQNGKVNRRVLPKPDDIAVTEKEETRTTDNVLETALKELISGITGVAGISVNEPLIYSGLSSIGVIRLISAIQKRYGVKLSPDMFKDMSLKGLENEMLTSWMEGKAEGALRASSDIDFKPYKLSAAQLGVYMEVVKKADSKVYNLPFWFEFDKEISVDDLKDAIGRIIDAHPSVNIHFETIEGQVMAVKNEQTEPVITVMDMTNEQFESLKPNYIASFHPGKEPLYSFAIIRTETSTWLYADFHHLIFDGYSMDIFTQDLKKALSGEEVEREGSDYSLFVRDQQAFLSSDDSKEFDEYFSDIFEKYDSPSRITPDLPKSDIPGIVASARASLDPKDIDKAVRRAGVSEAAFLLSVLYYVVARLSNSDDVYISTISAGRSDVRFSDTFGMFVNTLPLSSTLTGGTVDEYIKKTAADLERAIAHENYPFAAISDKWGYTVEIMYAYQRGIVEDPKIPHLLNMAENDDKTPMFPVKVSILDDNKGPVIEIVYDDSLYSAGLMEKICCYYRTVMEQFVQHGDDPLRKISLLDEREEKLLADFHTVKEESVVPDDTFFFTGMERNAAADPDHIALIASDGTYTYKEFDSITDRVANALIKRGAKVGEKALVLLPRTSRALFAFYGASKAGLGYIPFDPAYPTERVNLVIEDSDARFVITTADMLQRFDGKNAVDIEELLKETDDTKPHVAIDKKNISYMIYTSGSTGRPKGVMLSHEGMAHYVADMPGKEMVRTLVNECSVYCSITTLSFDISVMEYSLALSNGLTLFFANEEQCNNAELLAKRMIETKTDCISGTPSRIHTLLSSDEFCKALKRYGKLVICGGEKYPEKLMEKLKGLVPHPMNLYGPSEITISCNEHDLTGDDLITVGKPTPGVTEYIVDTDGNELPVGVVGEVYIGGWGVGLGYNNLDELTGEKFIDFKGERVYKSGDYGRWLDNGYLEIIGRKDNQIKLRGLRIELGEVETVLGSQKGMKHVAVKIEKINGIEHLCAWFTNEEKVDIRELKKEISKTLTPYMVPTAYMQLDRMPFTPNGKLDLKNLPVPEVLRGEGDGAKTETEKIFCEIFSSLLGVENVLATEDFFALGGTSLLVTKVVIEAANHGYNIVFGDVFAHPTPRELASLFEEGKAASEELRDPETEDYDYSKINELLACNDIKSFKEGSSVPLGHVLLTGATGYLGIHILHELIENTDSMITCMVRASDEGRAWNRLCSLLFYYFDKSYQEMIGDRLLICLGDVTDPEVFDALTDSDIDTVINCAAIVKHFSRDTIIEDINVGGAVNIIEYCVKNNVRMVHTSTMSVVEMAFKDRLKEGFEPNEKDLYFGQDLTNKYVHSKFLAERAVLEAVAERGLRAKILRYGNLAARFSDGEFQANFKTNSAMGNLRGFAALGCVSFEVLDDTMEFSPIDEVAKASVMLCTTPDECRLFHVISDQNMAMIRIFNAMNDMGVRIGYVEPEEFEKAFDKAKNDPSTAQLLTSLMAYDTDDGYGERVLTKMNRKYTYQVLFRLGFSWSTLTEDYIRRFINALKGLGYFDFLGNLKE